MIIKIYQNDRIINIYFDIDLYNVNINSVVSKTEYDMVNERFYVDNDRHLKILTLIPKIISQRKIKSAKN